MITIGVLRALSCFTVAFAVFGAAKVRAGVGVELASQTCTDFRPRSWMLELAQLTVSTGLETATIPGPVLETGVKGTS
jgi:hypothetical protein